MKDVLQVLLIIVMDVAIMATAWFAVNGGANKIIDTILVWKGQTKK